MIIKKSDSLPKKVGNMKISEYNINQQFSAALIELNGTHGKIKCTEEDRIYHIINGSGLFEINGKEQPVQPGDTIFIHKNTAYDIKGKITFFMICSPKFNSSHDIIL